ncbi:hypothetical protein [Parabacteroides sp.]
MKKLLTILGCVLLLTACGNDDEPDSNRPTEVMPVIEEGMEMFSQVLVDDQILEESIDKVVNFGNAETPLLFHVNQQHTLKGRNVPEGKADMDCAFYSLTEKEYMGFIKLFAIIRGIATTHDLNEEQKLAAFIDLSNLLQGSEIELALLIYLVNDDIAELEALDQLLMNAPATRSSHNSPNSIMASMLRANIKPTTLLKELDDKGISFSDLVERADYADVNIPQMMLRGKGVTEIIKTVVDGVVLLSKLIVAFVENAQPVVDIESTYASYLHESDLEPLNYYGPEMIHSQTYECRYGTKQTPMAQCKFYIEGYIKAKHKTLEGSFIPRIGMVVERVRATAGMHVEGTVTYSPGQSTYSPNGPVAYCQNEVTIKYGDCCCFARTARLKYSLNALWGFEDVEWDN